MYMCKYCEEQFDCLDDIGKHLCFNGQDVYFTDGNVLCILNDERNESYCNSIDEQLCPSNEFSSQIFHQIPDKSSSQPINEKTAAVWTRSAVLALLALYEANMHLLENPRLRATIWSKISEDLLEYGIQMTSDQVRWKMNALNKIYKEVVDNNSRSGRGRADFKWFEEMDSIFGKTKDTTVVEHTVSSQITLKPTQSCKSNRPLSEIQSTSKNIEKRSFKSGCGKTSKSEMIGDELFIDKILVDDKIKSRKQENRSKVTKSKGELEKQWLEHLKLEAERDRRRDKKYEILAETKKESLKLKKQQLLLKEQELQQKRDIAEKKLHEKRHLLQTTLEVERKKLKLLKNWNNKENKNKSFSESDKD